MGFRKTARGSQIARRQPNSPNGLTLFASQIEAEDSHSGNSYGGKLPQLVSVTGTSALLVVNWMKTWSEM